MEGDGQPMLSMLEPNQNWMDFELETNPLHGDYDQFVSLGIKPSIFKYHAPAVNTAIGGLCFLLIFFLNGTL